MICEECKKPWIEITIQRNNNRSVDIWEGCATEGCSRRILFIGVRKTK